VWKARDKELDRAVAIKIPRQGGMTAEEQEKFFREARAAAQLRHPRIVSVHEVGRDGDSVYIVSDFVRGVTLGDWLTGQQLTSREAAELCANVADALDHAHENGIIHRDLKPANIMMDGDGEPHLMDFGLARRDAGEVTITMDGQVVGTPAYMSPEQAEGKAHAADRRSDVYSLGVILFQLLTGELPFRGNARMLMHQVINDEPPSPRKLNASVAKDLETITLKCLEKDPSRRYQSAAELTAELKRYLNGDPIRARPIGGVERAWRWCKRKPAVAALSAAAVGLLLAVAVVASIGYANTARALNEKEQAAATAEQVSQFLTNLFRSSDPIGFASGDNFAVVIRDPSASQVTVRELMDRGVKRIETELAGQPEVQATLLETIGGVYRELGEFNEAARLLEDALHRREKIVPRDELKIAAAQHNLGFALHTCGKYADSERYLLAALKTRQRLLGKEHLANSSTLQTLALVLTNAGRTDDAERYADEAVAIRRRLKGNNDQSVAIALAAKAAVSLGKGDPEAAHPAITEGLLIFAKSKGRSYAIEAVSNYQQGMLAFGDGRYEDAATLLKTTLDTSIEFIGPGHPYTAFVAAEYALVLEALGKYQAACDNCERAMEICKKTLPPLHPMTIRCGLRLHYLYVELGRFDDALAISNRIMADARTVHGDQSYEYSECLTERANLMRRWGKIDEGIKIAREGYAIVDNLPQQSHSDTWHALRELAECLLAGKLPDEVITLLNGSSAPYDSQVRYLKLDGKQRSQALELLGRAFHAANRSDEAIVVFRDGQNLAAGGQKARDDWVAWFQVQTALVLIDQGRTSEAKDLLTPAHSALQRTTGPENSWTKQCAAALESLRVNSAQKGNAGPADAL
jgi:serine/threonine-protein kinase